VRGRQDLAIVNGGREGEWGAKIWPGEPRTLPAELSCRRFAMRKNPQLHQFSRRCSAYSPARPRCSASSGFIVRKNPQLHRFDHRCSAYSPTRHHYSVSSGWVDERGKPTLGYETGDAINVYWHGLPVGVHFFAEQ
jgi:hypothetical protein